MAGEERLNTGGVTHVYEGHIRTGKKSSEGGVVKEMIRRLKDRGTFGEGGDIIDAVKGRDVGVHEPKIEARHIPLRDEEKSTKGSGGGVG
jgi:hypothetical protein